MPRRRAVTRRLWLLAERCRLYWLLDLFHPHHRAGYDRIDPGWRQ